MRGKQNTLSPLTRELNENELRLVDGDRNAQLYRCWECGGEWNAAGARVKPFKCHQHRYSECGPWQRALTLIAIVLLFGCGGVTSSALTTDGAGPDDLVDAGDRGGAGGGAGGRGGAAQVDAGPTWGPLIAPACAEQLLNLSDCGTRIEGRPGGFQCAKNCRSEAIGGVDLARAGACVFSGVTYCVPPAVDGGDPCAACSPPP